MKYTFLDYKKMSFSSKLLYLKSKRINIADPYIGYYDNLHRTVEIPSIHKVFGKSSLIINLVPPQPALKNHESDFAAVVLFTHKCEGIAVPHQRKHRDRHHKKIQSNIAADQAAVKVERQC